MGLATLKPRITAIDTCRGAAPAIKRIVGRELGRIRNRIGLRDEYICKQCGRVTAQGEVDHIVPLHLGGRESDENRQWLCRDCHTVKSAEEERGRGGSNL